MSKSKGNVIDPLDVINDGYGADTLRTYEMFIGPVELDAAWDPRSVGGVYRFLNRCWNLCFGQVGEEVKQISQDLSRNRYDDFEVSSPRDGGRERTGLEKFSFASSSVKNKTIKKVTEDIVKCNFNTAVSALMEYVNYLYKAPHDKADIIILAKLLKPFAPHLASEMLEKLGADDEWPTWDETALVQDTLEVVVQINGKLRAKLSVSAEDAEDEEKLRTLALENDKIQNLVHTEPKKVIVVKKANLVNIVI